MSILVFNAGSTTLKFSLYRIPKGNLAMDTVPEMKGIVENKGKQFQLEFNEHIYPLKAATLQEAVVTAQEYLHFSDVQAIGHRVVHGGDLFKKPVMVTSSIIRKIDKLSSLAPLHNPMNVEGIRIAKKMFPKSLQAAVFDTSFHSQMPTQNTVYPIPLEWYKKGIKRFGFHGINHQYCFEKAQHLLKQDLRKKKVITCHLGGGASLAAIANGYSVDTTMGFTPMEGLMMASRSGSIDPGIIFYLLETKKLSVANLKSCLNDCSGLKGIAGTSDMREVIKAGKLRNEKAVLALQLFNHSLIKAIGAMTAPLGGLDCLVFTGGIGENAPEIRRSACQELSFLGIELDIKKNEQCQKDEKISCKTSQVDILRIKANEEWFIAKETLKLLSMHSEKH